MQYVNLHYFGALWTRVINSLGRSLIPHGNRHQPCCVVFDQKSGARQVLHALVFRISRLHASAICFADSASCRNIVAPTRHRKKGNAVEESVHLPTNVPSSSCFFCILSLPGHFCKPMSRCRTHNPMFEALRILPIRLAKFRQMTRGNNPSRGRRLPSRFALSGRSHPTR